jgi:hypothetical protein
MKFTIQVLIESPDALPLSVPIRTIERSCERVEEVGLRLEEAKAVLHGLQEQLIRQQLAIPRCPPLMPLLPSIASHQGITSRSGSLRTPVIDKHLIPLGSRTTKSQTMICRGCDAATA